MTIRNQDEIHPAQQRHQQAHGMHRIAHVISYEIRVSRPMARVPDEDADPDAERRQRSDEPGGLPPAPLVQQPDAEYDGNYGPGFLHQDQHGAYGRGHAYVVL